jgi:hypothetical protein
MGIARPVVPTEIDEQAIAARRLSDAMRDRAGRVRHRLPIEAGNVIRWASQIDIAASKLVTAARAGNEATAIEAWMNLRAAGVLIYAASTHNSSAPCLAIFDDEPTRASALLVADNADRYAPHFD